MYSKRMRFLALLLVLAMAFSVMPMAAFATETEQETNSGTEAVDETVEATEAASVATETAETAEGSAEAELEVKGSTGETVVLASEDGEAFVSETHTVFSRTTSTIAPGVTQDICYAYASDGKQMVFYIATADISRDDVDVYANYKDNQCAEFGMAKLTEQMAAAQERNTTDTTAPNYAPYYTVVAGVNADFYNMTTGRPSGAFVMEGVVVNASNNRPFFGIQENGTPVIGYGTTDWNTYNAESPIVEAVGGSQVLVWNGADVTATASGSYNTDRHSRTCVGITADGKVVMMVLDGRQEPFSCGGSMHELAQIMLEAGCVAAINLDGGGSTTFAARQEGADEVTIVNRPSDGSERSISSSLMIVSTAIPSDTFDRAVLTAEESYVTPGSIVSVTATGVSPAGTSAQVPEDVSWQLADSSLGTVENGLFVSNGTVGDAVVQMVYNGSVVGSTTIHVVIPEAISFDSGSITVPYGKTVTLEMTATYGLNEVTLKDGDVTFTLTDDAVGTVNGFALTACEENETVTGCTVNAVLAFDKTVTASAEIILGKGSVVVYDFEDGSDVGFFWHDGNYNYVPAEGSVEAATAENGQAHSGSGSLKLNINFSNSLESGYQRNSLYVGEDIHLVNATSFGMWIYIPDEAVGLWARYVLYPVASYNEDGTVASYGSSVTGEIVDGTITGKTGYVSSFQESGWHYLSIDLTGYTDVMVRSDVPFMQFYISDRDGSDFGYDASNYANIPGDFVFYIDDVTIDYSSAVDDRDAPVFSSIRYADETMSDAVELNGQTTAHSTLSFGAVVHENTKKSNYTGLDASTATAYIDGVAVDCTYAGGIISVSDVELADGVHTVKFSICDKAGNYASEIRTVNVQANSGKSTIKVVAHDETMDRILFGSLYYVDVVATDIETVSSVNVQLDLNSLSTWELDHMDVAEGFEAVYTVNADENIATVTINRTGSVSATGEAALVSMPIRAWQWGYTTMAYGSYKDKTITYAQWKSLKEFWRIDVSVEIDVGEVTFTDGTSTTFSGTTVKADTEMWAEDADMIGTSEGTAYYNSWNGGHEHRSEYASYYEGLTNYTAPVALEDKSATCTGDGYTGRTYCETCNSVVDWGTTIPATGHTYDIVDGVLKCVNDDCGETFTGVYTDGKAYVDGVVVSGGWVGESYYVDGEVLTGVQLVDGFYYDFGDDGVCVGKVKYTGVFYDEEAQAYRYSKLGELSCGWTMIDEGWYYFDETTYNAATGTWENFFDGVTYEFEENGKLVSGVWVKNNRGYRYFYGPDYYRGGGNTATTSWITIDGATYCIDDAGYRYEGLHYVIDSNSTVAQWYDFGEDGALIGALTQTGALEVNGKLYYLVDGASRYGLALIDGDYYYMSTKDYAAVTGSCYVAFPNGLLPKATYAFGDDRKMTSTFELRTDDDGEIRFYVDGTAIYAGLVRDAEGNFYYINSSLCAVKSRTYTIYDHKTNDMLPAGEYTFGADGKMITGEEEELKNGLVFDEDGEIRYYENGVAIYIGLVQDTDGNYYYINSSLKAVKNCTYTIYSHKTNGLLPAGEYTFGADGKMVTASEEPDVKNGLVFDEDGEIRYYVDGVATYAGLVQDADGNYYYINSSMKAIKSCTYTIYSHKTNGLLPAGTYTFGADGKMVIEEEEPDDTVKNGLITDEDGEIRYYVDGVATYAGLVQDADGNYYYINSSLKAVKNCTYTIYSHKTNGLLPAGTYTFGADGKMIVG